MAFCQNQAQRQGFAEAEPQDPLLWLRLIRSRRVGPASFHKLLAEHGDVEAALAALPQVARAAGVENYALCPIEVVRHEWATGRALGAQLLLWGQPGYPLPLMDLPDAPPVLWGQGDIGLLARPMVALVGARNASSLGLRMTRRLALGLAEAGQVVVSGLARGIDAEAHQAALQGGTVAVQAGGVDVIYPQENAALAGEIARAGCLLSEQPMGLAPQARHFPQRNRIVSGLARAVVVVEAAARSGSLLTARNALDQGREVLAVPGHPFDARAAGCNICCAMARPWCARPAMCWRRLACAGRFAPKRRNRLWLWSICRGRCRSVAPWPKLPRCIPRFLSGWAPAPWPKIS